MNFEQIASQDARKSVPDTRHVCLNDDVIPQMPCEPEVKDLGVSSQPGGGDQSGLVSA